MHRQSFRHDGLTFSFLDTKGPGLPILALHGHWMGGSDFEDLAERLAPEWRVIALDQRGFGETDATKSHSMPLYVTDVIALLDHLGIAASVPVLGHSFGGIVAWHLAAAHPARVRAMIIEDIGVVLQDKNDFVRNWAGTQPLREALEEKLGPRLSPYLQKSIHRADGGWRLNFDPEEYLISEAACNGDHWPVWTASRCPALLIRGSESVVSDTEELESMAARRSKTALTSIIAGHSVHIDNPGAFEAAVRAFLAGV